MNKNSNLETSTPAKNYQNNFLVVKNKCFEDKCERKDTKIGEIHCNKSTPLC